MERVCHTSHEGEAARRARNRMRLAREPVKTEIGLDDCTSVRLSKVLAPAATVGSCLALAKFLPKTRD